MKRFFFIFFLLLLIASVSALVICNNEIIAGAAGKLYDHTDSIPYRRTGLLLGTGRYTPKGFINRFYKYRIQAARALLQSGKISYLIISGDNSRKGYDEPSDMRADLMAQGIDSTCIYLDYAGFRTFDSMKRAKEIFGQDSVTIISQPFHNERALYIASQVGLSAIAFNAHDVPQRIGFRTMIRERFARVKVFVDRLTGKQPKFMGAKVVVG